MSLGPRFISVEKIFYVYLLTNADRGVFYIGLTTDLPLRIFEHRNGLLPGFTKRYNLVRLVWYEAFGESGLAFAHEKRLKRWRREWKIALVEKDNPHWLDLYDRLNG